MKVQKTISLTADTLTISNKMENFSGWVRARLRQFDEGIDPVDLDLRYQAAGLRMKTLRAAIEYELSKEDASLVMLKYMELMEQKRIGDFK